MIVFKNNTFHLQTQNTSYIIGIVNQIPLHCYWGKRLVDIPDIDLFLQMPGSHTFSPPDFQYGNAMLSTNDLPMEYPAFGSADLRSPAFHARYHDGSTVSRFAFDSYEITDGKYDIKGLPATYSEQEDKAQTLRIHLLDSLTGLCVTLMYGVFEDLDAITRSVVVENTGNNTIELEKIISANVDFKTSDYDFIHLQGAWARERTPERVPLFNGRQQIESMRGASSHNHNPFFALAAKNADENMGEVYGFNLVYSGNFTAGVEVDSYSVSRAYIGINPFEFKYILEPGNTFYSPEAVLVYSDKGIGEMSRIYHRLFRNRLCRGKFRDTERYVLLNNWEATYFEFDEEKILDIARKGSKIGIDLMVLDDGWFGKRNSDNCSLGDWVVNKEKLPNGLSGLSRKIEEMGMKFGLWFEPEMVSPDSDLYRAHPDWCLHVKDRSRSESRNQLVLDLSRKDVCEYIKKALCDILDNAKISYVKWDMNRNMTEVGSALLGGKHQGEVYHRYILGLYSVLEYITTKYPNILFESCSGGGGRFDAGMLYYMPQTWTSDDTDAEERLMIQYGTSICYPYSAMGAHASAVPNHQVSRTIPMKMRCEVAMPGQFGFELDLNKVSEEDLKTAQEKIGQYKQLGEIFHKGDLYRLHTPDNGDFSANEFISEDGNTVILCVHTLKGKPNDKYHYLKFKGLDKKAVYGTEEKNYTGEELMQIGLAMQCGKDFESRIVVLSRI